MMTAEEIIRLLRLEPHPREGGYFRETYRAAEEIAHAGLPGRYNGPRAFGTSIYFLLTPETFSEMHRLASDEVFHFYLGDPVEMLLLEEGGAQANVTLGPDIRNGHHLQVVVNRNVWQGSRLAPGGRFALLGTTVAPGFDFADYESGNRAELSTAFPEWVGRIRELTRA